MVLGPNLRQGLGLGLGAALLAALVVVLAVLVTALAVPVAVLMTLPVAALVFVNLGVVCCFFQRSRNAINGMSTHGQTEGRG